MKRLLSTALAIALFGSAARADVKPHALFSEGAVLQRDKPCPVWGTADPDEEVVVSLQPDDGKTLTASTKSTKADGKGRWLVTFDKFPSGGTFSLKFKGKNEVEIKNVVFGEVWLASGQSNMEWPLDATEKGKEAIEASANPNIRLFTVPKRTEAEPVADLNAHWEVCGPKTVKRFSAVAYYFGRDLQKALNVPVGLIHTSWGGTIAEAWTPKEALAAVPELNGLIVQNFKSGNPNQGTVLYNGMIAPLLPYAARGAIWYQGESNADRAKQYQTLFPTMIESWRAAWKDPEFGFYFVQLAPFKAIKNEPSQSTWAELREAQLMTTKLPHTGMAVITDVGDEKDIHPKKKEPVGGRLAIAALANTYGEKIEPCGPVFDSLKVEGDKAILSFKHVGKGLEAKGGPLTGFAVAGEDGKFYNAVAAIEGDTVVVTSDKVSKPVAVRFGWADFPVVNLWNKDGLPASPFRTDTNPIAKKPRPVKATN